MKPRKPSDDDIQPTGELRACPDFLNEVEKQCWNELVADMPPGVLKNADNFAVESFARLQAMIRTGTATPSHYAQALAHSDRFGLNPRSRPNVKVPPAPRRNAFADLDD